MSDKSLLEITDGIVMMYNLSVHQQLGKVNLVSYSVRVTSPPHPTPSWFNQLIHKNKMEKTSFIAEHGWCMQVHDGALLDNILLCFKRRAA